MVKSNDLLSKCIVLLFLLMLSPPLTPPVHATQPWGQSSGVGTPHHLTFRVWFQLRWSLVNSVILMRGVAGKGMLKF